MDMMFYKKILTVVVVFAAAMAMNAQTQTDGKPETKQDAFVQKQQKKQAKKRECRQQPVLNLMLYSLGITREQYKSINKSRKR